MGEDSILLSIKKLLGIDRNYNVFDQDIIIHINSVFGILHQLGLSGDTTFGPFYIRGEEETWNDFLTDERYLEMVKSYMYLRVKLLFDPPDSGVLHEAVERQISEMEWRINIELEGGGFYEC